MAHILNMLSKLKFYLSFANNPKHKGSNLHAFIRSLSLNLQGFLLNPIFLWAYSFKNSNMVKLTIAFVHYVS